MSSEMIFENTPPDWSVYEDEARRFVIEGDYMNGSKEHRARLIGRALNSRYLGKDAQPLPEDEDVFIGALLERYFEMIDTQEESSKERDSMVAALSVTIEGLKGTSSIDVWDEFVDYVPSIQKKGIASAWFEPIAEAAKVVRNDIGAEALRYAGHERHEGEGSLFDSIDHEDVVVGYGKVRDTILDLLDDADAPLMNKDMAAAMIVALGLDHSTRLTSPEKVTAYKRNVMLWVGRRLAYTTPHYEDEILDEQVMRGRNYLKHIACHYPLDAKLPAIDWLAISAHKSDPALYRHFESHIGLALNSIFTPNS